MSKPSDKHRSWAETRNLTLSPAWRKCPEGRCVADEFAAERLKHVPLTERYCFCRGDREWVIRKGTS